MSYIDWLNTPTGRALLREEGARVRPALESIFGDQYLQIGAWGSDEFPQYARTKRAAVVGAGGGDGVDIVMASNCLGIANDSIDIVLLPHVLEAHEDPHGVLRELNRVLRSDGHIVILGFNPVSFWGLRHLLSRRRFPPGLQRLISEYRLRDWLHLLNFSVDHSSFHYFPAPVLRRSRRLRKRRAPGNRVTDAYRKHDLVRRTNRFFRAVRLSISAAFQVWRQHAPFASCYMLVARKAMYTVTPIKATWRPRRQLVGGLVNPSTRNVA